MRHAHTGWCAGKILLSCHGELPEKWWRDKQLLQDEVEAHGSQAETARAHGARQSTLSVWWLRHGFEPLDSGTRPKPLAPVPDQSDQTDQWLLASLKKLGDQATIEALADHAERPPKDVRAALERLGAEGYRIAENESRVVLERVPPKSSNLHTALFDGELLRVGLVSDTHLGSDEEALAELHLAYDIFEREGISEVWHAGDWGTGLEIFRGHHSEAHVHTLDAQVDYLEEHYPRRKGITTRGIAGNHDLQGTAGKAGFDPVAGFANRRDDIDYLGAYEAWIELRPGTGRWVHLLHPGGGMSYSYSYKAQKLVDSYPSARKPAMLITGHWHVRGNIRARDVEVIWPGCFEWQSPFMARLGLQPTVGFHILELTVAEDGSIVRFRPEWFPFFAGRKVEAA